MDLEKINKLFAGEVITEVRRAPNEGVMIRTESGKVMLITGGYCKDIYIDVKREVVELEDLL